MNDDTKSYTRTRTSVIDDHFELFLRCANMSDSSIEKMLLAVENHELEAVGVYLEDGGYRIAEVEFSVDWEKHLELIQLSGNMFDTDIGGWRDGVAPEAYISVQRLVKCAKEKKLPIHSWIMVSDEVRRSPSKHKKVCQELGYAYNSGVEPWEHPPKEKTRQISGLEEAQVTTRERSIE